jgi:hypothetical protein
VIRAPGRPGLSIRRIALTVLVAGGVLLPAIYLVQQTGAPEQVAGLVRTIVPRPPLGVASFDLLTGDGRLLTFEVGPLDTATGFDAGHLVVHRATQQPVVVTYRRDGNRLVAIRLADARGP